MEWAYEHAVHRVVHLGTPVGALGGKCSKFFFRNPYDKNYVAVINGAVPLFYCCSDGSVESARIGVPSITGISPLEYNKWPILHDSNPPARTAPQTTAVEFVRKFLRERVIVVVNL